MKLKNTPLESPLDKGGFRGVFMSLTIAILIILSIIKILRQLFLSLFCGIKKAWKTMRDCVYNQLNKKNPKKGDVMMQKGFGIVCSMVFAAAMVFMLTLPLSVMAVDIKEGMWENTIEMKMEIPGMPFSMPATKFSSKQCLTKKDAVPNTADKEQKCDVKDYKVAGNKVTWKIKCTDKQGTIEGEGEVTYSGASYSGNMKMKSSSTDKSAPSANMAYKLSGKYLGECKK